MSSQLKPIKLWGHFGPNPTKVHILLEELALPYEAIPIEISDVKAPAYLAINPNGRVPAILDPNTNLTLWETGAIFEYLIERYDSTAQRLSFPAGSPESYHAKQWLHFQTSGQGPYYGQAAWFKKYHPEPLPSAIERYVKEIKRVSGVLDGHLARQKQEHGGDDAGGPWLVGNKLSYADLAFVPWQHIAGALLARHGGSSGDEFPHVKAWLGKMVSREKIGAVLEKTQPLK